MRLVSVDPRRRRDRVTNQTSSQQVDVAGRSHRGWPGSARPNPPLHAPAMQGVPSFGGIPTFVGTQIAPVCFDHMLVKTGLAGRWLAEGPGQLRALRMAFISIKKGY